jgi:hypothetical protein
MAAPYNYMSALTSPDIMESTSYLQSLKGQQIQREAQEAANRKAQLANQQLQKQMAAIKTFQGVETPGLEDFQALGIALGGEQVSKLGEAFSQRTDAENAATIQFGGQFMSALKGSPDYAVKMLDDRIEASDNDPQTQGYYRNLRSLLADEQGTVDPEGLQNVIMMTGTTLASVPGAENMFNALNTREDVLKKRQMAPEEIKKAKADALVAANTANFAELTSVSNLAEMGLDVSEQLDDPTMQKAVQKLATLKRRESEAKSNLELRNLQLQVYSQEKEIADVAAERANEINTLGSKISTTIDQVNKIKKLGEESDWFGTVLQQATGPIGSRLVTLDEDVANFEEALEVLNSQVFLNNVDQMRGLGTLTDAEGQRLSNASGSLSLRQGPEQFEKELNQIIKLLELADKRRLEKYPDAVPVPEPVVLGQDIRTVDVPGIGPVTIQQVK